jgi:class 3 adenylate cyclase
MLAVDHTWGRRDPRTARRRRPRIRRVASAGSLPAGTLTLFFSDIEGSTRLLERLGERYCDLLGDHHRTMRAAVSSHGGHEIRTQGDAFFVVFTRADDALQAVVAAQRGLAASSWPDGVAVRVRMGLHTGAPQIACDDYVGIDVHRAARICSAAHGGQVVLSDTTARAVAVEALDGIRLRCLGEHRLKDLTRPLSLHQVVAAGLPERFPPLRTHRSAGRSYDDDRLQLRAAQQVAAPAR